MESGNLLRDGIGAFQREHAQLLAEIRRANPCAIFIVGDIYEPAVPLSDAERRGLVAANSAIHQNCQQVHAVVAPIHDMFQGRSQDFLCLAIEPTLLGAMAIAGLFDEAYRRHGRRS